MGREDRLFAALLLLDGLVSTGCRSSHDEEPDAGHETDAGGDADGDTDADADGDTDADADSDTFFDSDNLVEIEITIPPDSWAALEVDPFTYQPGSVRVGDTVLEDVGIRLKGAASFRDLTGKAAFKVKTDEFVSGQRLFGLRRLTLNNFIAFDASGVHERLGYAFFRAAGVPAPRCNSARVSVNGEYWGLYANVESLDDVFVESRYGTAPGNLFDLTTYFVDLTPGSEPGYQLETNEGDADISDLTALIEAVNGPDGSFVADAEERLDLDEVLALGAVQAIIADWDGYFGATNNYKLYHDVGSDRFVMFPWGIDQTFGATDSAPAPHGADYDIFGSQSDRLNGLVFVRCKADPECLARYRAAVGDALEVWRSLPLEADLDNMVAQIRSSMEEDPRRETDMVAFDAEIDRLRGFLRARAAGVQAQLDGPLPELCENGVDDEADSHADCDDRDCSRTWSCMGRNFSCLADPDPDPDPVVVPESLFLSGAIYAGDFSAAIPDATVEIIAQLDGTVLASTTSDADGNWSLEVETAGVPLEAILRRTAEGRIPTNEILPPLTTDQWIGDPLFSAAELDDIAAIAGFIRDPTAGVVFAVPTDCSWNATAGDVSLVPAAEPLEIGDWSGLPLIFNVPPGDYELGARVQSYELGPIALTVNAGELTEAPIVP